MKTYSELTVDQKLHANFSLFNDLVSRVERNECDTLMSDELQLTMKGVLNRMKRMGYDENLARKHLFKYITARINLHHSFEAVIRSLAKMYVYNDNGSVVR